MNPNTEEEYEAYILLVDDEEDFLELLSARLKTKGMNVTTAACGEEALKKINRRDFDIVVIDLSMPGMDGIETMRKIKAKTPQTEIIMLTGHASLKSGIEAMKCGAEDYLEKPLDMNILLKKINEAKFKRLAELEKSSQIDVKKILKSRGW